MTESFPICSSLEKSEVGNGYSSANAESSRLVDQSHAHFSRKELKTRVRGFGKGRPLGKHNDISLLKLPTVLEFVYCSKGYFFHAG